MIPALSAGFGLGLSLIVAIGAQNAFVLQTGVRGRGVGPVVVVCIVSDVLLIAAGVAGLGALVTAHPGLLDVVRWAGVAVLLGYAARTLWSLRSAAALRPLADGAAPSAFAAVTAALALTWLNPHVYLDTVLLLGSAAAGQGEHRWWFAVGAALASTAWFAVLGFGARRLAHRLTRPATWRAVHTVIAVLLIALALRLATAVPSL